MEWWRNGGILWWNDGGKMDVCVCFFQAILHFLNIFFFALSKELSAGGSGSWWLFG